jgi:aryl-alcohol dehydrogenase-like predicted oxidoreductase
MKYKLFGSTGLYVSELCLGTMTFGGRGFWEKIGNLKIDMVTGLIKRSFDFGINFIDTANVYSHGESELLTGQAIKSLGLPRDELIIATKVYAPMNDLPNGRGLSRYHIMHELDASLRRLQVDHIDLYQLHGHDPLTPLEEVLGTLNDLVRSGKVRYTGVCNMPAWQIMKGLAISDRHNWERFASVQAYYTIAGRDLEREIVPLVQDQKLGLMIWSPLAGGLLSGKFKADGRGPEDARRTNFDFPVVDKERAFKCIDVMQKIADAHQVSVAEIALAWIMSRAFVSSVIIGVKRQEQLEDNIASTKLELSAGEIEELEKVSRLPPEYPGWMIDLQNEFRAGAPYKE